MKSNKLQVLQVIFLGIIAISTSYIALNMQRLIEGLFDIAQAIGAI